MNDKKLRSPGPKMDMRKHMKQPKDPRWALCPSFKNESRKK